MGDGVTEDEARAAFELVKAEIESYPWKAAGVPCWCSVIRLNKCKDLYTYTYIDPIKTYYPCRVVLGWWPHWNEINKLPSHAPNPDHFDRIPGVTYGWGPWAVTDIVPVGPNETLLDIWIPGGDL